MIGWHIVPNCGSNRHSYHPKVDDSQISIPPSLLPEEEKRVLITLADACLGSGSGRNYIMSKRGKFLSKAKIAYIQSSSASTPDHHSIKSTDVERLLKFFDESKDMLYQILWDRPSDVVGGESVLCSTITDGGTRKTTTVEHLDDEENAIREIKESANRTRLSGVAGPADHIFVCCAWASKEEIRLMKLFLEVIHCDATCDSNNTKNHLPTFSIQT